MPVDVLAIGAHPDDIEIFAGGTLAAFRRQQATIGLLHLTRGEAGTRGSPEQRADEAAESARALGAEFSRILDLGDGRIADTKDARDALIGIVREHRPRLLLAPLPSDDHPDHAATGALAKAVWYLAGIRKVGPQGGDPHRASIWFYPSHEIPTPSTIVTLTQDDVDRKFRAIACYSSQFRADPTQPTTRISDPRFLKALDGRLRHFGAQAGAEYGEPFVLTKPFPVRDLRQCL